MGQEQIDYVFDVSEVSGANRLMLLAIARRVDDQGVCAVSLVDLADDCAVQIYSARRTIRRLEERGEIATEFRRGAGNVNIYRMKNYRILNGIEKVVSKLPEIRYDIEP